MGLGYELGFIWHYWPYRGVTTQTQNLKRSANSELDEEAISTPSVFPLKGKL